MSIPDYQTVMLPLLRHISDGQEHATREVTDHLAQEFELSDVERRELLPSGRQSTFDNRVGWARTYLKKAGLLANPRRGIMNITDRGREVLSTNPDHINVSLLEQFDEFTEFKKTRRAPKKEPTIPGPDDESTPEESLEAAFQKIRDDLADDLLRQIKECSPTFFEHLVIDLLVSMGYGGSRREAGTAIGQSGDGGVDGSIKEDKLGLDVIFIQAKRWEGTVGRPEIQKFAGALQGQRSRKGIFITTSGFSKEALDYVSNIETKIILIDGTTLADLMIDHDVGVSRLASYDVKRVDTDYFTET
jgi:restriction system protein